jgi:hypothetical protein
MLRLLFAIGAVAAACDHAAADSYVAFRFAASLAWEAELFGHSIGPDDTVSGRVVYRTVVPGSSPAGGCGDCAAYPIDIVSGFSLEVGELQLRYDSYQVTVFNDGPGIVPETFEDVLTFGRNDTGPASYPRNLLVNGTPTPVGFVDLALVADPFVLASAALPTDPQPTDFFVGNLLLDDGVDFVFGFFDLIRLERVPVAAGDYFADGEINSADYAVWRSDFGSTIASSASVNCDGVVDAADYTTWRDAVGSASLGVPEPGAIVYAGVLLVLSISRKVADDR